MLVLSTISTEQMTLTRQLEMQLGNLSICKRYWRGILADGRWHLVLGCCQGEQRKEGKRHLVALMGELVQSDLLEILLLGEG